MSLNDGNIKRVNEEMEQAEFQVSPGHFVDSKYAEAHSNTTCQVSPLHMESSRLLPFSRVMFEAASLYSLRDVLFFLGP